MTNSDDGLQLAQEIVNSVAAAYRWSVLAPQSKTPREVDGATLASLVGKYVTGSGSNAVTLAVRLDGKTLLLQVVGSGPESRLYAESRTRFFTLSGNEFTVNVDARGRVRSLEATGTTFRRE